MFFLGPTWITSVGRKLACKSGDLRVLKLILTLICSLVDFFLAGGGGRRSMKPE